jgi:hypothetical protein
LVGVPTRAGGPLRGGGGLPGRAPDAVVRRR